MVENSRLIKYKDLVESFDTIKQGQVSQDTDFEGENVLLFFSFDIVNSSLFKTVNNYGWSFIIDGILESVRNYVSSKIINADVWRVLGDEIIFIVKISDKQILFEYVEIIYDVLMALCLQIDDGSIFKGMRDVSEVEGDLVRIQGILSLQATAWIANVTNKTVVKDLRLQNKYIDNIYEEIEVDSYYKFFEFRGVDIDTGFRLSKQTREKNLILSFELAYLLSKNNKEYAERLHILTYRTLKGVWNNSFYPIIWYYDSSKNGDTPFNKSLPYDAVKKDDIYVEYFGNKMFERDMYDDVNTALDKICKDKKLERKIQHIEEVIKKDALSNAHYLNHARLELHCVAMCFNEKGEIFCAQRAKVKYMPYKWEFGCAKANYKENLADTIVNEYKKDFGIEIELLLDADRIDSEPIPIAVYKVDKGKEQHKGVIFVAKIKSGNVELKINKHTKYKFINKEDLKNLDAEEFVPDAIDSMKKAFKLYEENKNEEN